MIFVPRKNIYFPKYQRGHVGFPVGMYAEDQAVPQFTGDPYTAVDIILNPLDAGARIQLNQAGNTVRRLLDNGPDVDIGNWGDGSLDITDFDFRIDTTSGTPTYTGTQAADVWVSGASGIFWGSEETGLGIQSFVGTLRVRPSGGGSDFDTATATMTAESTN